MRTVKQAEKSNASSLLNAPSFRKIRNDQDAVAEYDFDLFTRRLLTGSPIIPAFNHGTRGRGATFSAWN